MRPMGLAAAVVHLPTQRLAPAARDCWSSQALQRGTVTAASTFHRAAVLIITICQVCSEHAGLKDRIKVAGAGGVGQGRAAVLVIVGSNENGMEAT